MEVNEINEDIYEVYDGDEKYIVMFDIEGNPGCTCKGYWYNGHCKHIDAVMEYKKEMGMVKK